MSMREIKQISLASQHVAFVHSESSHERSCIAELFRLSGLLLLPGDGNLTAAVVEQQAVGAHEGRSEREPVGSRSIAEHLLCCQHQVAAILEAQI